MVTVVADIGNGCRVCESDDPQGCVPNPRDLSGPDINCGYFSLKDNSRVIDALHEVRQFPPLGKALHAIDGKDSPWETIGCGPGQFKRPSEPLKFFSGTYLHLVFRTASLNSDRRNHMAVELEFGKRWEAITGVGVDVVVEPLSDYWGDPSAWAQKFEIAGKGASFDEAWRFAVSGLRAFLCVLGHIEVQRVTSPPK